MFDRFDAYTSRRPRTGGVETSPSPLPGTPAGSDLLIYLRAILSRGPSSTLTQERTESTQDDRPEVWDSFAHANHELVAAIAQQYANRGLTMMRLLEAGTLGLQCALEGFDPEQGALFSTYASWWIKQAIKRALLNASRPGYIPGREA